MSSIENQEIGIDSPAISAKVNYGCIAALKDVLHTPLYWLVGVMFGAYCLMVWVMGEIMGMPIRISFLSYQNLLTISAGVFVVGALFGRILFIMIFLRPRRLFKAIADDYRQMFTWERFWHAVPFIVIFPIFFSAFTSFKTFIPELVPFSHDVLFAKIDRFIHFGIDPWRLIHPFVGFFAVTYFIAVIYKFWFLIKFMCLYWQGFSRSRPALRAQFFIAYFLTWIINGTFFALILSSAGPCFYSLITGDLAGDPYFPLIQYLQEANEHYLIGALYSQAYLWDVYTGGNTELLSGISAMPSMHVSVAFMLLLLGWHYGPIGRVFFTIFFVLTVIGSIHLGWHYAIDGYFAIITTFLIWKFSGWLVHEKFKWHTADC